LHAFVTRQGKGVATACMDEGNSAGSNIGTCLLSGVYAINIAHPVLVFLNRFEFLIIRVPSGILRGAHPLHGTIDRSAVFRYVTL
jgi:hypothetical protein